MKLVVFDLDGVLVDIDSSWQLIHRAFGADNEQNFQRYLQGAMGYKEFMRSDISLWRKVHIKQIEKIFNEVPIMKTAPAVLKELKRSGYVTAIISSGISILAERVKKKLNIDYCYSNRLLVDEQGWLTGEGQGTVELLSKNKILRRLMKKVGVGKKQCFVIGDSQFDLPLFKEAGFSIAFNIKDEVIKLAADLVIDGKDLTKILPWLISNNLMKANFSIRCDTAQEAKAIASAVLPDNLKTPFGLKIRTWSEKNIIKIKIVCLKRIETMLFTLDDLFSCLQIAEKALKTVKKHK